MNLGQRIKELRIKKGLTQLELANILFVNDRTISKWEQERGDPNIKIIPSLAEALGVSIDYLMTGKEYVPTQDDNENDVINYFELLLKQKITDEYVIRFICKKLNEYDSESVKNAIDICYETYLSKKEKPYDNETIRQAVNKIGGILHNQSLSPIDQKISHIILYLSNNTNHPSTSIKNQCDNSIRDFLSFFMKKSSDENKIEILDEIFNMCKRKHFNLYDLINFNNSKIEKEKRKNVLKNKIANGYLSMPYDAPKVIEKAFNEINRCLINDSAKELPHLIIYTLDSMFKNIIERIDKTVNLSNIPFITDYYHDINIIFGPFIKKIDAININHLVDVFTNENIDRIHYKDLDLFQDVIDSLVNRINSRLKSARKHFNRIFFVNQ